jgi:hypothetical protein
VGTQRQRLSCATGEQFCYLTVERESVDRVVWVRAWRTAQGPATTIVVDKKPFRPVVSW